MAARSSTQSPLVAASYPNSTANASDPAYCGTLYDHRAYARVLIPIFYSVVFTVGLLGNALALHVIRPNLKNMNSTTMYSLNLVVSDILFTLSLPLRIIYYARGFDWPLGEVMCKVTALIFYINTYSGVNFMTCLSVDRFIAVAMPVRFARCRKSRNVRYVCVAVWAWVLMQTLPLLAMPMTKRERDGHVTCMEYPVFDNVPNIAYTLIGAVFLGYVIPMLTILGCYSILFFKLSRMADKSGRRHKAIGVICCVSLVFVVCFSPYHIDLLQYMVRKLISAPDCAELTAFQVSLHFTVCLMNLNSTLDPFVYFFACKGYKRKVMRLLRQQVSASLSSAARNSVEGSSRDVDANKIPLNASRHNH